MTLRTVVSSAMLILAALSAGCSKQQTADSGADATARPAGMSYEAHVNAGGIAPPALPPPEPSASDKGNPKAGEGLFSSMNCDGCHGGGATGWEGPSLVDGRWRYGGAEQEIFQSIFYGRPKGMPAYGGVLGTDGVWMIVSYLKSQAIPSVVPTTNYEELDKPAPPAAPAAADSATVPKPNQSADPRIKIAQYGCTACHAIDKKVVGPAFKDVAAKYKGQAGTVEAQLEAKVKNGGVGVWGDIPMPPNTAVPDDEIHTLVNWVLTSPDVK